MERCFALGMRKELLQTDEQKQKRRKCLEENRTLTSQRLQTSDIQSKTPSPNCIDHVS